MICGEYYGMIFYFQAVITQINLAIGASGFVSQECKVVVTQYGKTILDLLVAEVYISVSYFFQYLFHVVSSFFHSRMEFLDIR